MTNYHQALIFAYYEKGVYAEGNQRSFKSDNTVMEDILMDVIFDRKLNFS